MQKKNPQDGQRRVDAMKVSIHQEMPAQKRLEDFLQQIQDPYCFRCGDIDVEVAFASQDAASLQSILARYFARGSES